MMQIFFRPRTYVIVDLIDSLYCSYVFIASHYPDKKLLFVTHPDEVAKADDYDFVFVPTEHFGALKGCKTDLVVNTASFGEMSQGDVDAYMKFINHECDARYFYSVNRYGRFDPNMSLPDQANVSVKLTQDWDVLFWDAFGARSFHQLDPANPPQLELFVQKIPPEQALARAREMIAGLLAVIAGKVAIGESDWHYCMWESVRLFPSQPVIKTYVEGSAPKGFRDAPYYGELSRTAAHGTPRLTAGAKLEGESSLPQSSGSLRQRIAGLFRG
ncbi:MAG: putative sugar O-methyltransferase [Hyphomicrobiales bacterium]